MVKIEVEGGSQDRLRVLHLIVSLSHSNAQFNEHCLPLRHARDISICSFSRALVDVPREIHVFEGDGTVRGFAGALDRAFTNRSYDVVHAHAPGTGAMLAVMSLLRRRPLSNAVLTVHNSRQSFPVRNQLLVAGLFRMFRSVVFCSHAAHDSFPSFVRGIARGSVEVVQNGIDTERVARAVTGLGATEEKPSIRVVSVGRLIPRKDPMTVVRAFELASRSGDSLTFVGDGALRSDVLRRARSGGMDSRVAVTGLVARDQVYRQVAGSDLFVSASRSEGLPVAILEAMATGCPVIASDIPPHREIVDASGLRDLPLFRPNDPANLADEIRRFASKSKAQRIEIGERYREAVEATFSLEAMHSAYGRIYERVAHRGASARNASSLEVA